MPNKGYKVNLELQSQLWVKESATHVWVAEIYSSVGSFTVSDWVMLSNCSETYHIYKRFTKACIDSGHWKDIFGGVFLHYEHFRAI